MQLKDSVAIFFLGEKLIITDRITHGFCEIKMKYERSIIEDKVFRLKKAESVNLNVAEDEVMNWLCNSIPSSFFVYNLSKITIEDTYLRNYLKIETIIGDGIKTRQIYTKIVNTKVAILGIGSLGSHIIQNLILFGFKNLILIDFDKVELSNLNRQIIFQKRHVGQEKIVAAKEFIHKLYPSVSVDTISKKVKTSDDLSAILRKADFMILTADTPVGQISSLCASACKSTQTEWVRINRNGYGPFWTLGHSCPNCHYIFSQEKVKEYSKPTNNSINSSKGVFNSDVAFRVSLFFKDFIFFLINKQECVNVYCHTILPVDYKTPIIKYERTECHPVCYCND